MNIERILWHSASTDFTHCMQFGFDGGLQAASECYQGEERVEKERGTLMCVCCLQVPGTVPPQCGENAA